MKKQDISSLLRKIKLLYIADWMRFYWQKFNNRKINKAFIKGNPNFILPPDYLIYESFRINYPKYYESGKNGAKQIISRIEKYIELKDKNILDWGCGPARIIRHFPDLVGDNCSFYGTDYNKKTIDWNLKNIKGIQFNNNDLEAKLPYKNNYFDVIYGLSVLTHLSEKLHYDWFEELHRVLNVGGILLLTTQGDNFKNKMTDQELAKYNNNELVVRGNVLEGHRTYSAFHPKKYMENLFRKVEVLDFIETTPKDGWIPQDVWIAKKV
ncbi:MAG: class I SAM-dependent methyltransferase [Flavobacteriaceae bacterium]